MTIDYAKLSSQIAVAHQTIAEQSVRALPHEHQVRMAELVLAGWKIKFNVNRWEAYGPKAPAWGPPPPLPYFTKPTLLTLIESVYYSGYFGPKGGRW